MAVEVDVDVEVSPLSDSIDSHIAAHKSTNIERVDLQDFVDVRLRRPGLARVVQVLLEGECYFSRGCKINVKAVARRTGLTTQRVRQKILMLRMLAAGGGVLPPP